MRDAVSSDTNINPQSPPLPYNNDDSINNGIEIELNGITALPQFATVELQPHTDDLHLTALSPVVNQEQLLKEPATLKESTSNGMRCTALEPPAVKANYIGKCDSGLASISSEYTQTHYNATQTGMTDGNRIKVVERCHPSVIECEGMDARKMLETSSTMALTGTEPPNSDDCISITDSKSITTTSIGDRSLTASSTISPEDEVLSLRVRSLYDSGVPKDSGSQILTESAQRRGSNIIEEGSAKLAQRCRTSHPISDCGSIKGQSRTPDIEEPRRSIFAEGLEDWENLEGQEIDRYGFINSTYISSSAPAPPDPRMAPRRVATALFVQSQQPRKRALKHLRLSSSAPEMLQSPLHPKQMREKEDIRSRKWREMAILRKKSERETDGARGAGVEWSFVVRDPKLISRTWKGIPDCWRGAAWHAFLSASAKSRGVGKPDAELVIIYYELLDKPSSDDVQIDLDVPRTINSHIMFRRRYRGGQRLLFRVLHSLALYSPEVGYVQGMASLAATLLCYFDEETTFIMLIRLWELRGLEKLYKSGFGGLMEALEEFENGWMKGNQINKKLTSLGVSSTAYGTRWYLTLFNYSIPFPAQLRVWDVFMLLGDPDPNSTSQFGGTLDVLHATSAAILDGMKSIILKSDFEEAMKNLTSFLPVKDEDMLMKVAKSEWKMRKRR